MTDPGRSAGAAPPLGTSVAAIILAAGGSTRLGRPKQLIEYHGLTLLRRAVLTATEARLLPVVVLGCEAAACQRELAGLHAHVALNAQWHKGIGSSLRLGVAHVLRETTLTAAIVMLCDQPLVDAAALERIVSVHHAAAAPVVAAKYADTLGVPALFAGAWLERLLTLADETGAKAVIQEAAGAALQAVDLPEAAVDIDLPGDWARIPPKPARER